MCFEHPRRKTGPPGRRAGAEVKSNAAKLARVRKHQGPAGLAQHEMIVPGGAKARFFHAQFSSHAQVQAEPGVIRKSEGHLFSMTLRMTENGARQSLLDGEGLRTPKDSFGRVRMDRHDASAKSAIPLAAVIFNFGQFRHERE